MKFMPKDKFVERIKLLLDDEKDVEDISKLELGKWFKFRNINVNGFNCGYPKASFTSRSSLIPYNMFPHQQIVPTLFPQSYPQKMWIN